MELPSVRVRQGELASPLEGTCKHRGGRSAGSSETGEKGGCGDKMHE